MTIYQTYCTLCNTYNILKKNGIIIKDVEEFIKSKGINPAWQMHHNFHYVMEKFTQREMNNLLFMMGVTNTFVSTYNNQTSKSIICLTY